MWWNIEKKLSISLAVFFFQTGSRGKKKPRKSMSFLPIFLLDLHFCMWLPGKKKPWGFGAIVYYISIKSGIFFLHLYSKNQRSSLTTPLPSANVSNSKKPWNRNKKKRVIFISSLKFIFVINCGKKSAQNVKMIFIVV